MDDRNNLGQLVNKPTRRQAILSAVMTFGGLALWSAEVRAVKAEDEISHNAESIHQEAYFKAGPKRVYEALTNAKQFDSVVQLSAAMKSKVLGDKPTEIINEEGVRSHSSVGISQAGRSNFCRANVSSKPGVWATGSRASTRLLNSSSPSRVPGPRSFLTT